jgi:hypothetical protein
MQRFWMLMPHQPKEPRLKRKKGLQRMKGMKNPGSD